MSNKGSKLSPETRAKMSAAKRGHAVSPETRAKISVARTGHRLSLDHRVKLSVAHLGHVVSAETREKMATAQRGENGNNWKGGHACHSEGYALVFSPNHPFAQCGGYVFEHRLVMEEMLGRPLFAEELVHHINENKADNRKENLALCQNRASHVGVHGGEVYLPI